MVSLQQASTNDVPLRDVSSGLALSRQSSSTVNEDFAFWYPSWDSWQFSRTLSYWVSIMFGEGSILFVIGATFAMSGLAESSNPNYSKSLELVFVNTPYCMGAVAFTIGAYCGFLEVINLPLRNDNPSADFALFLKGRQHVRDLRRLINIKSVAAYSIDLIGAIAFNLDTLFSYATQGFWPGLITTWGMATVGGLSFTIGGILDCQVNKVFKRRPNTAQWWTVMGNAFGGLCFLIAGAAGLFSPSPLVYFWLIDFVYLVGSVSFLVASVFLLWMWKNEQYGLRRLPELNGVVRPDVPDQVLDFHAEYGCGKSSATQLPWLLLYEVNASISVLDIAISLGIQPQDKALASIRAFQGLLNVLLSHGILLLGSVIHHVPTKRPFSWLLMYMRFVLLLFTIHSAWAVLQDFLAAKSNVPK